MRNYEQKLVRSHILLLKDNFGLVRQSSFRRNHPQFGQLRLQNRPRDRRLDDVGTIETVDAIDSQNAALNANDPVTVQPAVASLADGPLQRLDQYRNVLEMHSPEKKIVNI